VSALTVAALVAVTAAVARLVVPARARPAWSDLLPPAALALVLARGLGIGLDAELLPLVAAAVGTTVGAARDARRRRRGGPGAHPILLVGNALVASALLVGGLYAAAALRSEAALRGPEALPAPSELAAGVTLVAEHPFLRGPRDLAFNPRVAGELWVVNGRDHSVAIIHDALSEEPRIEYRRDAKASHFMHRPSALAFGADTTTIGRPGTFATAQESSDDAIPFLRRTFMGPTLFSSDLDIFARPVAPWLLGSHLDMLHESPLAMGIAWERDHVYWVAGGNLGTLTRYDFVEDHGVGHDDHANGVIRHYVAGAFERVPGVPSHLAFDHDLDVLYLADTASGAVRALDTTSGRLGGPGPGWEAGVDTRWVEDAVITTIVAPGTLVRPSGLVLHGEHLLVGDHATGRIHVFTRAGRAVEVVDTGAGADALMGLALSPGGALHAVDAARGRVLRVTTAVTAARVAQPPAPDPTPPVAARGAADPHAHRRP
jgi:hypothetical protein